MAQSNQKYDIVLRAYELLKFCIPTIDHLPKRQKYLFGDRLQNHLSDLMEMLIDTFYCPREEKSTQLRKCNVQIEKIRYYFRLGYELNFYSAGFLGVLVEKLDEIGRMCGAWKKQVDK